MRKSTIWLLALVMAFAFAGLLYLQITYLSIILKTRNEQFSEAVKTSLYQVSRSLELEESARYLEEDLNENEKMLLYDQRKNNSNVLNSPIVKEENLKFKLLGNDGVISEVELKTYSGQDKEQNLS
ncbi:MAG: two-component sensor histidine kinase, partial [Tannerellaceae bacterium]